MKTLDEIALHRNADKASHYHGYTRWYEKHLERFRGESVTLIEIGIAYSFSLLTWRDYLGPQARIIGIDIDPEFCTKAAGMGFEVHCGDALNAQFLKEIGAASEPMIVIDDGNHHGSHQQRAFETLWPFLKDGGLYIVEDLHAAYWGWGGRFMPYLYGLIDKVNHTGKLSLGAARNEPHKLGVLDDLERTVQAMHFYPSIVFIDKADKTR
jgi:hypothetical protein